MQTSDDKQRQRITVNGIVQGVGFRPFVYRLATELSLAGFIANDARGVRIEVEGSPAALGRFRDQLQNEAPPLARIDTCTVEDLPARGDREFHIEASEHRGTAQTQIPPDIAVCHECLHEMNDPKNRRYRYPFINCTNCGPRFTIVGGIPYDRPLTSMKVFPMCVECEEEYHDPRDRRFHAQPVACPVCGPRLIAHDGASEVQVEDPIGWAIEALQAGKILAVRGLGGFHLAVDAANEAAVQRLRDRKQRQEKPLAIMADRLETIKRYCEVSADEEMLLLDVIRPIVLLKRRGEPAGIAPSVVYDNRYYGFMLPYTPVHHLLLQGPIDVLVMTSGNLSEEPIAIGNEEAIERLAGIADLFLLHDREILQRCDDSIVRHLVGESRVLRRARGYVPRPVYLPQPLAKNVLAVGGELKNTVALCRGDKAFLSQHIGDLDNPAALGFFEHAINHLENVLEIEPELIACDMHPEYLSTKSAKAQTKRPVIEVQHHHAHQVAVMTENAVTEPTIGIILDGTGHGTDGTIWGGEVLIGDAAGFNRYAWLEPVALPGGTAAIQQPWRMALSYLHYAYGNDARHFELPLFDRIPKLQADTVLLMIERRLNSPMTSSCGRLFDGIAALIGLCIESNYEAQAAIALEMAATRAGWVLPHGEAAPIPESGGPINFAPLVREMVRRIRGGESFERMAVRFHTALAELFIAAAHSARITTGIGTVALSGGVYQNALFFEYMVRRLSEEGFRVLSHCEVPTNDGGLALGQAVIADAVSRHRGF